MHNSHSKDSDCTVNEETECCDVCGVSHGEECPDCGGRGFHKPVCPVLERSQQNRTDSANEPLPEPTDIDVYQAIVNEIKTHWANVDASVEYPGCVHVSPSNGSGKCYVIGDVNETWGADVYADTDAMESGDPAGSIDLEIPRENVDAVVIVKAFLAGALTFDAKK
jgi:hypothetical protein